MISSLVELSGLEALAAATATEAASIGTWFELIKRVPLVHMARERLATLDDQALLNQLAHLKQPAVSAMVAGHFRRHDQLAAAENEAVARAFGGRKWPSGTA